MLKALADGPNGRKILIIGLSFGNLEQFRQHPGDTFIRITGDTTGGIPLDVMIFSGESEAHLAKLIEPMIGSDTKVNVSGKLQN